MNYLLSLLLLGGLSANADELNYKKLSRDCGPTFAKLMKAQNEYDIDALSTLFSENYESENATSPQFSFQGRDVVTQHWEAIFALGLKQTGTRDFKMKLISCSRHGNETRFEQYFEGGYDENGENPCFKSHFYAITKFRREGSPKKSYFVSARVYHSDTAFEDLTVCNPEPETEQE